MLDLHGKLTKVINWQNSGGREALNSRGKGSRREALLGETRSGGTGASHPGQESDQSLGMTPISHSH